MSFEQEALSTEDEPPDVNVPAEASCEAYVDQTMAMVHLSSAAHVVLIGHHTFPLLLALLRRGCGAVRCLRPGAPSPDCEMAELAWIVDLDGDDEIDGVLRAARGRIGDKGRVMVEGRGCAWRGGLVTICERAMTAGFDIISFDHKTSRLMLAVHRQPATAAQGQLR